MFNERREHINQTVVDNLYAVFKGHNNKEQTLYDMLAKDIITLAEYSAILLGKVTPEK